MKSILKMLVLLFFVFVLNHLHAQEFKQIQNRWKSDQYLHNESRSVEAGPLGLPGWHSAHWQMIPVAGTEYVQIKNRFGAAFYLHNEYGQIQVGALGKPGWWSAQWKLVPVVGTDFVRIQNRWKPDQYLHNQNGKIEVSPIGASGWWSAHWKIKNLMESFHTPINFINPDYLAGATYFTGDRTESWLKDYAKGWMGKIPGSTKMSEISIPGTHDSGATRLGDAFECQSMSIQEQLASGIRYFDIRVSCGDIIVQGASLMIRGKPSESLLIYHGIGYMGITLKMVLDDMKRFLDENPTEAIIMRLSTTGTPKTCIDYEQTRKLYIQYYQSIFYSGTSKNPTLEELRGKIYDWDKMKMKITDYEMQDDYAVTFLSSTQKQGQVKAHIDKALNDTSQKWYINYTSGAVGMMPYDCAKHVNPVTYDYLGYHVSKRKLGMIIMDFPGSRIIYRIIQSNFQNQVQPEVPNGIRHYVITVFHLTNKSSGDDGEGDIEVFGSIYTQPSAKVTSTVDTDNRLFYRASSDYLVLKDNDPHYSLTARQNFFVAEENVSNAYVDIICRLKEHDLFSDDTFNSYSRRKLYDIPVGFYKEWDYVVESNEEEQKVRIHYAMTRVK